MIWLLLAGYLLIGFLWWVILARYTRWVQPHDAGVSLLVNLIAWPMTLLIISALGGGFPRWLYRAVQRRAPESEEPR